VRQRTILLAAAWVAGAALIATGAAAAVDAVGSGLLGEGSPTLSQDEVQRRLASATPPAGAEPTTATPPAATATPTATPTATANAAATARVLASAGGTIVASCAAGQVTLLSWSPAQGYRADEVNRGPASSASVKFKAGRTELTVIVTCAGDRPEAVTAADNHH
jgi:hypothetical protein